MRTRLFVALVTVSACAGRYHTTPAAFGQATAIVQPRNPTEGSLTPAEAGRPWAVGGGLQLPAGSYELALWFDVPRAQLIEWTVSCPGVVQSGALSANEMHDGKRGDTLRIVTTTDGVCVMTAISDDAEVLGTFRVRRSEVHAPAMFPSHALAPLTSNAAGHELAEQRHAEATARVEAAQLTADDARLAYLAYLGPHPRSARGKARVDKLQHRLDLALRARAQLSFYMLEQGAIARPPMPVAIAEEPGPAPYDGAEWAAGTWVWTAGRWQWREGHWTDPDVFNGGSTMYAGAGGESNDSWGLPDDEIRNPPPGYGGSREREHRPRSNDGKRSSWRSVSYPDAKIVDHTTGGGGGGSGGGSTNHDDNERGAKDKAKDASDGGGGRFVRDHR
jgi:hypothetical protein